MSARNDAQIIIAAGCCFPAPRMPRLPSGCRCNNLKSHNKATYCLRRWRCPRGSNNNYFSLDLAGDVARIEFQRLSATANVQVKCIRHWFHSAKPYLRSKCTASIWSFFFVVALLLLVTFLSIKNILPSDWIKIEFFLVLVLFFFFTFYQFSLPKQKFLSGRRQVKSRLDIPHKRLLKIFSC